MSGQSPTGSPGLLVVVERAVGMMVEAVVFDEGFLLNQQVVKYISFVIDTCTNDR